MKKIFVLGALNQDLVISAPYMPEAGESLKGGGFFTNCGGKGANQAAACGKNGVETYMVGCVGNDVYGAGQTENLKSFNVRTEFIRRVESVPTGTAVIVITDGNNRIVFDPGANSAVTFPDVKKALDEKASAGDYFICQLEIPIEAAEESMVYAKSKGLITILNPAPAAKLNPRFLKAADIIIPNESETALLTGIKPTDEQSIKRAAAVFFGCGIKTVIITLGPRGAALLESRGELKIIETFPIEVVDTTAAGDTFIGALTAKLAGNTCLADAVRYANAAASLAVSVKGAQSSIPDKKAILEFLKRN